MDHGALLFPFLQLPDEPWVARILLYWPTLGMLLPESTWEDPDLLGARTLELRRAGLVQPVRPIEHATSHPAFVREFLARLPEPDPGRPRQTVHAGKLGRGLMVELMRDGRASQEGPAGMWFDVDAPTAELLLTSTALYIQTVEPQWRAVADPSFAANITSQDTEEQNVALALLEEALPLPAGIPPADDLLDFRHQHGAELRRFRRALTAAVARVTAAEGQEALNVEMALLRDQREQAADWMSSRGWPVLLGGLYFVVHDLATTTIPDPLTASGFLALSGVAGSVVGAVEVMKTARGARLARGPLAYALAAEEQFG